MTYKYPDWAITVGWILACLPIAWIPLYAIYKAIIYKRQNRVNIKFIKKTHTSTRTYKHTCNKAIY